MDDDIWVPPILGNIALGCIQLVDGKAGWPFCPGDWKQLGDVRSDVTMFQILGP